MGIATGQAVVGDLVGEGASREEAVVGETPNVAARLQALAGPGGVVISHATRRLVGGLFELDDLGAQPLKGFAEPLAAWRVAGEGRAEGRFEAPAEPLVSHRWSAAWRKSLCCCADGDQVKEGEGHVILLSGEPGIGKSRLVRELRARLEGQPRTALFSTSARLTTPPAPCIR